MKPAFQHYIRIKDGKPVGLPTDMYSAHFIGEQEKLEFGADGIPLTFEPFVSSPKPPDPTSWKRDHKLDEDYTKENKVWTRKWQIFTLSKKQQKAIKDACTARIKTDLGYTSWTWDDERGTYVAPIAPNPDLDYPTWWFEEDQAWLPFTIDADGNYVKADAE